MSPLTLTLTYCTPVGGLRSSSSSTSAFVHRGGAQQVAVELGGGVGVDVVERLVLHLHLQLVRPATRGVVGHRRVDAQALPEPDPERVPARLPRGDAADVLPGADRPGQVRRSGGIEPRAARLVSAQRAGGDRLERLAELLGVVGVDVGALALVGDALELAPRARLDLEADRLDLQVDPLARELLGDAARRWRRAVVPAVGHEHDRVRALGGQVAGHERHRSEAPIGVKPLALIWATRSFSAPRFSGSIGVTSRVSAHPAALPPPLTSAAVDPQADLRVVGPRVDQRVHRRLGRLELRAPRPVVVVHRLRRVEHEHDRGRRVALLGLLCRGGLRRERGEQHDSRDGPYPHRAKIAGPPGYAGPGAPVSGRL